MKSIKKIELEQVTCKCGEVIAACVQGEQDAEWGKKKETYTQEACSFSIVPVENFKFGKCQCRRTSTKYLKILKQ